jgi:hypothetical protein
MKRFPIEELEKSLKEIEELVKKRMFVKLVKKFI